jgi:hypothetical protein
MDNSPTTNSTLIRSLVPTAEVRIPGHPASREFYPKPDSLFLNIFLGFQLGISPGNYK